LCLAERPELPLPALPIFILQDAFEQRYGKNFLDACSPELTIQDWGVTYAEHEPHYDRSNLSVEWRQAGNIKGQIQSGGNPFEASRAREEPKPPMKEPYFGALFRTRRDRSRHYHHYQQPSSNLGRPERQQNRTSRAVSKWVSDHNESYVAPRSTCDCPSAASTNESQTKIRLAKSP